MESEDEAKPSVYTIVNGPRSKRGSSVDRALVAYVALAREAALVGDPEAEADYHGGINDLLDRREDAESSVVIQDATED